MRKPQHKACRGALCKRTGVPTWGAKLQINCKNHQSPSSLHPQRWGTHRCDAVQKARIFLSACRFDCIVRLPSARRVNEAPSPSALQVVTGKVRLRMGRQARGRKEREPALLTLLTGSR